MTPDDPNTPAADTLAKTFDPAAIEARWYAHWEANGLFRPDRPKATPFTIVNPPPNVTGSLHIGHALDNTLQDVVVRYERLRGKDALWVVGTDHAGIATQMVVERELEKRQDKRTNYSREDFIAKVWEWKHESGGTITGQLRRLGCSMDWSREQFTMDPHFTKAVTKVFVDLYNQKLIYRDKRLVNWDPKLKTAISDLEVETRDMAGGFWRFRYPLADGSEAVEVATTRPETMLADMAVAVHPTDERYAGIVGKQILQPLTGRLLPVVADEHADPELGSGVVKITPGHDFNDFEVGKRSGFKAGEMLNMFDAEAKVVQTADGLVPEEYLGLDRFVARDLVVQRMKEQGFLVPHTDKDGEEHDFEPRTIATPFGDRGGVVIEPWLTDQWYVDAHTLAQPPLEAVRSGAIEIVPKSWEKTFFNWMENIQPWCVSRQLWWGHRIPAWYGPKKSGSVYIYGFVDDGTNQVSRSDVRETFVVEAELELPAALSERYGTEVTAEQIRIFDDQASMDLFMREHDAAVITGKVIPLLRDPDVLDTWFSSALWPFATLGWPEDNEQNPVRPELVEGPSFTSPHAQTVEEKSGASTSSARTGLGDAGLRDAGSGDAGSGDAGSGDAGSSLLARHYPNDLLISGFDILFFWDARMAMQGMHIMGEPPWKRLYLHGLVRAPDGQKMSKSKGNVVDPLLLIDKFGADALRFFMAAMESQGRDIKMDERRVEGYRNFATKLWNAARFCQSNGIAASTTLAAPAAKSAVNRWIIGEVVETVAALDQAMADLRFDAAANAIYHFVWDTFCDWYIELIKGSFDDETKAVAGWVLDQILVMLHPFMPFVTEELWHSMGARHYELIVAKWPEPGATVDVGAKEEIEWVIDLVREIRSVRTELNIPPSSKLDAFVQDASEAARFAISRQTVALARLARVNNWSLSAAPAGPAAQIIVGSSTVTIPLGGLIDIAAERSRLAKALEASTKEAKSLAGRLSNTAFVEKAKPEAIAKARADLDHHAAEAERLAAALARLG